MMADGKMTAQISGKDGFIAALDQSGGSTPGALRAYGIPDSAYHGDDEMFRLMHEMRVRIMTAPAFTGDKVLAAILFEGTMDGQAHGKPVPTFLWEERGVIPFVKVDKGLEAEKAGVRLMKPIPGSTRCLTGPRSSVSTAPKCAPSLTTLRKTVSPRSSTAVRGGQPDIRTRAYAHHRAGSLDQEPG